MSKLKINQGRVVPSIFRFGLLVVSFTLIWIAFQYLPQTPAILSAIVICSAFPLAWSAYYILEMDLNTKTITEYIFIMGKRMKERQKSYEKIEKIFINQVNVSQNYHQYSGAVRTMKSKELAAYLLLSDGTRFYLTGANTEEVMDKKMEKITRKIKVGVSKNY